MKTENIFQNRNEQLLNFGFTIDDTHHIKVYNHDCGIWIADFALEQYDSNQWTEFINEFKEANHLLS